MDTITEARASLENQLLAAEDDIARLRAAIAVLEDKPQSAAKPTKVRPEVAKPTKVVPWGKLVSIVSEENGISATQLAKQTGGDQSKILELLKEHEGKVVRREGERRATKWFRA